MPATDTVYRVIAAAQARFPSRTARVYRELEKHRAAAGDKTSEQTARTFERALHLRERAEATVPEEWAGPVTDYAYARDAQRLAALAVVCAVTAHFADAHAKATRALAAGADHLPDLDVDDPASVTRWRAAAEQLVHDVLVNRPTPARTVQIVPVPRG